MRPLRHRFSEAPTRLGHVTSGVFGAELHGMKIRRACDSFGGPPTSPVDSSLMDAERQLRGLYDLSGRTAPSNYDTLAEEIADSLRSGAVSTANTFTAEINTPASGQERPHANPALPASF